MQLLSEKTHGSDRTARCRASVDRSGKCRTLVSFLLAGSAALAVGMVVASPAPAAEPGTSRATAAQPRQVHRAAPLARAGVPRNWVPKRVRVGDYVVRRAGAVVKDLRVKNGDLIVAAPNVRLERVEVVGGRIDNFVGPRCQNGLRIVSTTVRRAPGERTSDQDMPAIGAGGYIARGVRIAGAAEGFRIGGRSSGCGPVRIIDSVARVVAPTVCRDWHGDALQGYDGPRLTIQHVALILQERRGCGGTAPFFYPAGQGNTSVSVSKLTVKGGGFPFRLGTSGQVRGLRVVRGSWGYGPIDVACSRLTAWSAQVVQPAGKPRRLACRTNGGY
jgi:hypothetical protein